MSFIDSRKRTTSSKVRRSEGVIHRQSEEKGGAHHLKWNDTASAVDGQGHVEGQMQVERLIYG